VLFGNRRTLAIEIQPLAPSWERRYLPEATGWAQLALWVQDRNVCRHVSEGGDRVRETLNLPLGPIADWIVTAWPRVEMEERAALFPTGDDPYASLARWGEAPRPQGVAEDDWVDAREAWWSHHFLTAVGGGACLPHVSFVRQDEALIVQWQPRFAGTTQQRPVFGEGRALLGWAEATRAVAEFVRYLADWFKQGDARTAFDWVESVDPFNARSLVVGEALSLFTGRSERELADLADATNQETLIERLGLPTDGREPAASPITQALRDLPPGLGRPAGDLLRAMDGLTRSAEGKRSEVVRIRERVRDAALEAASPEEAGYRAATAARAAIGLDGRAVENARQLLLSLGVHVDFQGVLVAGVRMVAGARQAGSCAAFVLPSERTTVEWGQRFECARALGHLLLDAWRSGAIGAASSAFAEGLRRRRSGAFAAEFLLPRAALEQATGGVLNAAAEPKVFEKLLEDFGVGARTAAYHLWNHRLLTSEGVRDQLIEDYARS
jgi:hypothetical protein